ncbi:MAG: type IV pilus assembly protein PilM [Magnetococcales bacterium]|nr:type IV pilus assembly protein PilM [Magnetococcales bacterium]
MPFFGPKYKPIVGLDIGTSVIRAMEVRPSGAKWKLHRWHQMLVPPAIMTDGKLKKSDEAVQLLKDFHKAGKFTTKKIALSIGGPSIISKKIFVDPMSEMELEDQISLEAEENIPFDIEEVYLDFQILGTAEEKMAVLLTACKKDLVEDKMEICREAGLSPIILDLDVLCLANAFTAFHQETKSGGKKEKNGKITLWPLKKGTKNAKKPHKDPQQSSLTNDSDKTNAAKGPTDILIALADVGNQHLNTVVLANGTVDYTRDLAFGAKSMIAEVVEQTGLTMEEVQLALHTSSAEAATESLKDAWENIVTPFEAKLAVQIRQSLDFFQSSRASKEKVQSLLLSGGAAAIAGIDQRLGHHLGIPVTIFNPILQLKQDRSQPAPPSDQSAGFAVSLGLALRGISP